MERRRDRRGRALLALSFTMGALIGCSAPAPASPTETPGAAATVTSIPPGPTPTEAPTEPPATPTPVPVPTFATTWELAPDAPAGAITIDMTFIADHPRFAPREVTVPAGTVVLFLQNVRFLNVAHQLSLGPEVLVEQAASPRVGAGQSGVLMIEDLPAGTYQYWCVIDGHYLGGMTGTLTVTP